MQRFQIQLSFSVSHLATLSIVSVRPQTGHDTNPIICLDEAIEVLLFCVNDLGLLLSLIFLFEFLVSLLIIALSLDPEKALLNVFEVPSSYLDLFPHVKGVRSPHNFSLVQFVKELQVQWLRAILFDLIHDQLLLLPHIEVSLLPRHEYIIDARVIVRKAKHLTF